MKKRLSLILLLAAVTLSGVAQTIGEAFYIYRNDGQFNAFFRDEVLSIDYSNYDVDSVYYDQVVTQVVNTADSVYKIPLAAIDSVGFVTPETKYKPGVIQLEGDILNYIISQESLSIFFRTETPNNLLPHIGDKLITMEMTDLFPIGFAGEVIDVKNRDNSIEVKCTSVNLLDVFEQYYGASEVDWNGSRMIRREASGKKHILGGGGNPFKPGTLKISLIDNIFSHSYKRNDNLAFTLDELYADISVTPTISGRGFWIIDSHNGVYLQLSINGLYDLEENFGIKGSVNWENKKEIVRIPWPILPLADVYLELGGFVKANAELGVKQKWTQQYKSVFVWEYSSKGETVLKPVNKMIPVSSNHSGDAMVKGSVGAGMYLEIGLDFIPTKKLDIANVNLEGRAGVSLEGSLVLDKTNLEKGKTSTVVYEQLRDTYLSLNWFMGLSANANILKYGVSHDFDLGGLPFKTHGEIARFCLAPTFSDVKGSYSKSELSSIDAEAKISCPAALGGKCLSVDAGLVLVDEDGNDASTRSYAVYDYKGGMTAKSINSQFYNVSSKKKLKVYPHIKWMGVDILASPYAEVETSCPDSNHPHWINLGLPSGTQWRCCNEGASAPEAYGGYYAFGQVSSAPTIYQLRELLDYCSYEWTTLNGVYGGKFTGPNGGTIFLPAAGCRGDGELYLDGFQGLYWSSTGSFTDDLYTAHSYGLDFDPYRAISVNDLTIRWYVISVRPVR